MNAFPDIKAGDIIKITWSEKYYGNQELGVAEDHDGEIFVKFEHNVIALDQIRFNDEIIRTEII